MLRRSSRTITFLRAFFDAGLTRDASNIYNFDHLQEILGHEKEEVRGSRQKIVSSAHQKEDLARFIKKV
jgi:hypothetical protein